MAVVHPCNYNYSCRLINCSLPHCPPPLCVRSELEVDWGIEFAFVREVCVWVVVFFRVGFGKEKDEGVGRRYVMVL